MKLRIKGNSLRLRIAPSELAELLKSRHLEETIRFAPDPDAYLTYALEADSRCQVVSVRYTPSCVTVLIPSAVVQRWADSEEVGIYGTSDIGGPSLAIAVEKDFACIDRSDVDNTDTFPNPHEGAVC